MRCRRAQATGCTATARPDWTEQKGSNGLEQQHQQTVHHTYPLRSWANAFTDLLKTKADSFSYEIGACSPHSLDPHAAHDVWLVHDYLLLSGLSCLDGKPGAYGQIMKHRWHLQLSLQLYLGFVVNSGL